MNESNRPPRRVRRSHRSDCPERQPTTAPAVFGATQRLWERTDPVALARMLLQRVTPEQLAEAVRMGGDPGRVPATQPASPFMDKMAPARLFSEIRKREGDPAFLRACLNSELRMLLANPDRLGLDAVAELLSGGEPAERVLAHAGRTAKTLRSLASLPTSYIHWALAVGYGDASWSLGALGLALLYGDRHALPDGAAAALEPGWKQACGDIVVLPREPAGWTALRALSAPRRGDTRAVPGPRQEPGQVASAPDTGKPGTPEGRTSGPEQAETAAEAGHGNTRAADPVTRVRELAVRLDAAAGAAARITEAFRNENCPQRAELRLVEAAVADFRDLGERLGHRDADSLSLATLREAADRADRLNGTRAALRALTTLSGPHWCEPQLAEVRARADVLSHDVTSEEPPDAADLFALADFIRRCSVGDEDDRTEISGVIPVLANRLPPQWHSLLALASMRQLSLAGDGWAGAAARGHEAEVTRAQESTEPMPDGDADNFPYPADLDHTAAPAEFVDRLATDSAEVDAVPAQDPLPEGSSDISDHDEIDQDIVSVLLVDESDPQSPDAESAPFTGTGAQLTGDADTHPDVASASESAADTDRPATEAPAAKREPKEAEPERGTVLAEGTALAQGRFALAAWIRQATGAPESSVVVREAAAVAAQLYSGTGELAEACRARLGQLMPEAFESDRPGAVLAWGVGIRAGLVAPTVEGPTAIRAFAPFAVRGSVALQQLTEAFVTAQQRAAYVVPEVLGAVRDGAETEDQRRAHARKAADFAREGAQRKIKYSLATEVWRALVEPGGCVGDLCADVALDEGERVAAVRETVARLRAKDEVERIIDDATRRIRANKKVNFGARQKLRALIREAVDIAAAWVDLVQRTALGAGPENPADRWLVGALRDLREGVGAVWERAAADLKTFAEQAGDPVEQAAIRAATALVDGAVTLLKGSRRPGAEPEPATVLRGELLLVSELNVRSGDLEPRTAVGPEQLPGLIAAALSPPDFAGAFDTRAARGDHVGTAEIIRLLRSTEPEFAQQLRVRREEGIGRWSAELRGPLRELSDRISSARRHGLLSEEIWSLLAARHQELEDPDRCDFDRIRSAAEELGTDLDDACRQSCDELRARLRRESANTAVAEVAERISERIDASDLTTAEEYLAQALAGRALPAACPEPIGVGRFFPAVPDAVAQLAPSGTAAGPRTAERIANVRKVLEGGTNGVPARIAAALGALGDLAALPKERRQPAARTLGRWSHLAGGPRSSNQSDAVRRVLADLGVESASAELLDGKGDGKGVSAGRGRVLLRLCGVRVLGDALLPQFGSLISPNGETLRVLLVWDAPGPARLLEMTREYPAEETVLVCYFGVLAARQRTELATLMRRRARSAVVVLDDAALLYLLTRVEPDPAALTRVLAPFTAVDPYTPRAAGDVPEEMFFGRERELDQIIDPRGSCIVYGGRQLGKSALLRAARRRVHAQKANRLVVLADIYAVAGRESTELLWPLLWNRLADVGVLPAVRPTDGLREAVRRGIHAWWEQDRSRQLLVLLDEADNFLASDAENHNFANIAAVRDIMLETGRNVKFVFAGLHTTARFRRLPNQPLGHFGDPVSVGPLSPRDAHELLIRPLTALGYVFAEPSLPASVLALANNAPALVQLFGAALLARMRRAPIADGTPPFTITRADVEAVWQDPALVRDFRDLFRWTLALDHRYTVIAYVLAHLAHERGMAASMTEQELKADCRAWWPEGFDGCGADEFAGLLEECVELGVVSDSGGAFRLRTPNLLRLLGDPQQIEQQLYDPSNLMLPPKFEGDSYRPDYCERQDERAPLTMGQLSRFLRPRSGCYVVAGSAATHLDRVPKALSAAAERTGRLYKQENPRRLDTVLLNQPSAGHRLLVADLSAGSPAEADRVLQAVLRAMETDAPETAPSGDGTTAVVLLTGPRQAAVWATPGRPAESASPVRPELVPVRRFDATGVRLWMPETELPFREPRDQERLLERTGSWPILIQDVISRLNRTGSVDLDAVYRELEEQLTKAPEMLLDQVGLVGPGPLPAAWRTLVQLDDAGDPELFAELLSDSGDPALGVDGVRTAGYPSYRELVDALEILGALVPDGRGLLRCEPVLAACEQRRAAAREGSS